MNYAYRGTTTGTKPSFKHLDWGKNTSLNVKIDAGQGLSRNWHYHPEMELILIQQTAGTRIIGTSIGRFEHNDVFLIGKNIPHAFIHDDKYTHYRYTDSPRAVVIQFDETFLGTKFLNLPELKGVQDVFYASHQVLRLAANSKREIIPLMEKMINMSPLNRIIILLEILGILVERNAFHTLIEGSWLSSPNTTDDKRMRKIISFTASNFDQQIKIKEVANLIHMTKESFCRYFKMNTGKTYIQFLTEVRIREACRELIENERSCKEIGYRCGFDSLSNFYHHFKKTMKQSPLEFQSSYLSQLKRREND